MRFVPSAVVVVILGVTSAYGQLTTAPGWKVLTASALSPVQSEQKTRAVAARDALFEKLSARLTAVVQKDGPAAAIAVCQTEAPMIAKDLAAVHGVKIGRTSLKLRNQANRPPEWVDPLLVSTPAEPVFLSGPGESLGALLPIRLKAQCLTCHGPVRSMPVEVRTELAKRYPNDRAVGYAEGDLRGWFWVEVAK